MRPSACPMHIGLYNSQSAKIIVKESRSSADPSNIENQTDPIFIETHAPVCVEECLSDDNRENLSESFWEEASLFYRHISDGFEPERGVSLESVEDVERAFFSQVYGVINRGNQLSDSVMTTLTQANSRENGLDGVGEKVGHFQDSSTESAYIPHAEDVEDVTLYIHSYDDGFNSTYSLWVRYQNNREIREAPLIYDTSGAQAGVIISTDVDYGSIEPDEVSDEFLKTVFNGGSSEELTKDEQKVVNAIQEVEIGSKTRSIIENVRANRLQ